MAILQSVVAVQTLSFDWALSSQQTSGELFKINQVWGDKQPGNYALVAQFFPQLNAYFNIKRIYPGSESIILSMPLPDLFVTEGIEARYLAFKMSSYYKWATVAPWTLTVTELYAGTP